MQYAEAERIDVTSIPVVDLTGITDGGQAFSAIGRQMLTAAERIGFFYIRNHGIPAGLHPRAIINIVGIALAENEVEETLWLAWGMFRRRRLIRCLPEGERRKGQHHRA